MPKPNSLDDASLRLLLASSYSVAQASAIELIPRTASWVARISSGTQRWWMRFERVAYRTVRHVETEAELLWHLHGAGCSVPAPLRRNDGSFASTLAIGGEPFAGFLSEEAVGVVAVAPTQSQARLLGRTLALLHQHGDSALARDRFVIDADLLAHHPLRLLAAAVPGGWYDCASLEALAVHLATRVWSEPAEPLPASLCHGDLHLENVCFGGDTPTLIDFGECGYGPSAYDLACYWRKRVLAGATGSPWRAEWCALLEGYGSVRPLEERELHALPALAALRAIRTMAMPALPGCETWGAGWLRERGYFESHLAMIDRLAAQRD